jgi:hypothetical protein
MPAQFARTVVWLLGIALLLAGAGGTPRADSWPGPVVKEVFSESREWFVRITPGKSIGDTFGFAGGPKGPYATVEFYRRQADRSYRLATEKTLLNPVAPIVFFVTDRGYLATLDNWHNMGYGKIAAFYTPEGEHIKAFELADFFSSDELERFSKSVSSIWWRTDTAYVRSGQQSLYVSVDGKGSELIFEIETGAWQFCQSRGKLHQCRTTNTDRKWQAFVEPKPRP